MVVLWESARCPWYKISTPEHSPRIVGTPWPGRPGPRARCLRPEIHQNILTYFWLLTSTTPPSDTSCPLRAAKSVMPFTLASVTSSSPSTHPLGRFLLGRRSGLVVLDITALKFHQNILSDFAISFSSCANNWNNRHRNPTTQNYANCFAVLHLCCTFVLVGSKCCSDRNSAK